MIRTALFAAIMFPAILAVPASAQQPAPTSGMPMATMPATKTSPTDADGSPSSKAFQAADDKMMHDMTAPKTGNADQDFVAGMLPHHQGAVDMAKVELRYGKNPQMRKLARSIIAAQDREIVEMKSWQAKHPMP